MSTVRDLKEHLEEYYNDEDVIAYKIWGVDDVMSEAKDMNVELSIPAAESILINLKDNYDPIIGISWSVLREYINLYIQETGDHHEI